MKTAVRIAVVGDRDDDIPAHRALPLALDLASRQVARPVDFDWVATDAVSDAAVLADHDGVWCVPGAPTATGTVHSPQSATPASVACRSSAPVAASSTR